MPINSTGDPHYTPTVSQIPYVNAPRIIGSQSVATHIAATRSSQPQPVSPLPPSRTHDIYRLQFTMRLLIILCLGSLGSLALAPYFLAKISQATSGPQYADGACTAHPQDIHYLQTASTANTQNTTPLPTTWSKAGKTSQDFTLAQSCAAAFTIVYESFNLNDPDTLTNATYMLSAAAKKRFFEGTTTEQKDERMDPTWQSQAHKEQLQQTAQAASPATLQDVQVVRGKFFALFVVTYQLTSQQSGKKTVLQKQLVVVLAAVPADPTKESTGWQVTDWYNTVTTNTPGAGATHTPAATKPAGTSKPGTKK